MCPHIENFSVEKIVEVISFLCYTFCIKILLSFTFRAYSKFDKDKLISIIKDRKWIFGQEKHSVERLHIAGRSVCRFF